MVAAMVKGLGCWKGKERGRRGGEEATHVGE
jgi:hypothetical protein